jgi:hypothetical protein
MYVLKRVRMYECMYYVRMNECMYMYVYVCMYVYVHVCITCM